MSRRRRREPVLRSNPFVVLSDMTIGLTFFFAVFSMVASLANSQAFAVAQRTERQSKVREELARALGDLEPGGRANPIKAENGDTYTVLLKPGGEKFGEIWENGNFQRIRLLEPVYGYGSDRLNRFGERVYAALAPVLKSHAREFAYVFVHGISEAGEATPIELSRRRADAVSRLLRGLGVISPPGVIDPTAVESKYAITYGTGNELYTLGGRPGRVDIVVFFKEAEASGKTTPVGATPR